MVHMYSMNGINIALDTCSGSVHVLDAVAYEVLTHADKLADPGMLAAALPMRDAAEIKEACDEISELTANGLLFSKGETLEKPPVKRSIKALCLHVAHECNMSCGYCFAGEGGYGGRRALMSAQTGRDAVDFIIKSSGGRRNLEIDFFGGEPLLNLDTVKATVAYARGLEAAYGKEFRFTLTTNGLLLNPEVCEFLNAEMDNVVLSIDGRKEVNDNMRRLKGGGGSYDMIVPRLAEFIKSREGKYYVRGTYTRENLGFADDVLHLAALGFDKISVEPVVAPPTEGFALTEADIPALTAEYERLAAEMLKHAGNPKFDFFHFNIDLTGGPCVAKRLGGCGAGVEYLAVTPDGDLYPCHQFVGIPEYKMGDLGTGVTNTEKAGLFEDNGVYSKPACLECWCSLYCGGGCAANAYHANGDIHAPYDIGCELQKKRTECAIMLKAAEAGAL